MSPHNLLYKPLWFEIRLPYQTKPESLYWLHWFITFYEHPEKRTPYIQYRCFTLLCSN